MKTLENKALDGGPSGARSRDLRIKRPSAESRWARVFREESVPPVTRSLPVTRLAELAEAAPYLKKHYPLDGVSLSCLYELLGAGFGVVGDNSEG